jgi:hypothetical protein
VGSAREPWWLGARPPIVAATTYARWVEGHVSCHSDPLRRLQTPRHRWILPRRRRLDSCLRPRQVARWRRRERRFHRGSCHRNPRSPGRSIRPRRPSAAIRLESCIRWLIRRAQSPGPGSKVGSAPWSGSCADVKGKKETNHALFASPPRRAELATPPRHTRRRGEPKTDGCLVVICLGSISGWAVLAPRELKAPGAGAITAQSRSASRHGRAGRNNQFPAVREEPRRMPFGAESTESDCLVRYRARPLSRYLRT